MGFRDKEENISVFVNKYREILVSSMPKYRGVIVFFMLLSILCAVPCEGVVKNSFRMRGLGTGLVGFVDDMYSDLYFNPAYIKRFNGKYIYTNLSNMQGKGEAQVFDVNNGAVGQNVEFPSNLIGGIGKFGKHRYGAFWEMSGYSYEVIDEKTNEVFAPGTPALDITSDSFNWDFKGNSFTWFGMFRDVGYMVSYYNMGMDIDWSITGESKSTGDPLSTTIRTNKEVSKLEFPNSFFSFALGKVYKSDKRETSISLGMMPEQLGLSKNNIFPLLNETFPNGSGYNDKVSIFDFKDLPFMELWLKSYFINFRHKTIHTDTDRFYQNSFIFSFKRYSLPLDITSNNRTVADTTTYDSELKLDTYSRKTIDESFSGTGSAGINSLIVGYGTEYHFDGLKNMIALGVKLQYTSGKLNLDQGPGILNEEYHKYTGSKDSTIYKSVYNNNKIVRTRGSANELMISIPVGLEMNLTKRFAFRLGARASIPVSFSGDWKRITTDSTNTEISSIGDSAPVLTDNGALVNEETVSSLKGSFINLTSYYFGAQYKVSDSITIDFLNFSDVTNLRSWWLSIVLKL